MIRGVQERIEPDDSTDDDDGEVIDAIDAELVPMPPDQHRIPASEVIDPGGVPYGRGGYARRLPGLSSRHYDPLRYTGWTQVIHPAD